MQSLIVFCLTRIDAGLAAGTVADALLLLGDALLVRGALLEARPPLGLREIGSVSHEPIQMRNFRSAKEF